MKEEKGNDHMIKLNFAGIHTRQELHRYLEENCSFLSRREKIWIIFMIF